jgi:XapX domain-containing protein
MAKTLAGIVLGLCIGAGCRWFGVPLPSPPNLIGALLVIAMTIGYISADRLIAIRITVGGILPAQRNDVETLAPSSKVGREAHVPDI